MEIDQKTINQRALVFIDVETTGLYPEKGARMCELACVKVVDQKVRATYQTLLNPRVPIPSQISAIHHITDDQVQNAPHFSEIAKEFLAFIQDSIVCGYNVGFDLKFINNELREAGYVELNFPSIDVLVMVRKLFPHLGKYKLEIISQFLIVDTKPIHRALNDALATQEIFAALYHMLIPKGIQDWFAYLLLYGYHNEFLKGLRTQIVDSIKQHIAEGRKLKIHYLSGGYTVQEVTLMPQQIVNQEHLYFLQGARDRDCLTVSIPITCMVGVTWV